MDYLRVPTASYRSTDRGNYVAIICCLIRAMCRILCRVPWQIYFFLPLSQERRARNVDVVQAMLLLNADMVLERCLAAMIRYIYIYTALKCCTLRT